MIDAAGEIVLALEGGQPTEPSSAPHQHLDAHLRRRFPGVRTTVLLATWNGAEVALVPPDELVLRAAGPVPEGSFARGGISGRESALRPLLQEGVRRGAVALALVAAAPHDESANWLSTLLAPIVEGGFDYVCPAYARPPNEGTLTTAIIYPLTRALYGRRLRQPVGGEAALSAQLARALLDDADWRRDPAAAGSDAWLVAKVLSRDARACQAWLGARPREPSDPDDASHALARVVGAVFREMERHAGRWQRVDGSQPLPTFGTFGPAREAPRVRVEPLVDAFVLGQRELAPIWALVLPPATMLGLRRVARLGAEAFSIPDELWARIVYDFAVAHFAKSMERGQLLLSMTPLYLGWLAGFLNETRELDAEAAEVRVEALCQAFEREKPYLISRWRWPDDFNP